MFFAGGLFVVNDCSPLAAVASCVVIPYFPVVSIVALLLRCAKWSNCSINLQVFAVGWKAMGGIG